MTINGNGVEISSRSGKLKKLLADLLVSRATEKVRGAPDVQKDDAPPDSIVGEVPVGHPKNGFFKLFSEKEFAELVRDFSPSKSGVTRESVAPKRRVVSDARMSKIYECLPTDADCELALEELMEEKEQLKRIQKDDSPKKTVEELRAKISSLDDEIEATMLEMSRWADDPMKARRVASMEEEVKDWQDQKAAIERQIEDKLQGAALDVGQLDLLIADIGTLRGYFARKSKQIGWFEERFSLAKAHQKSFVDQTETGNLSIDRASRQRDLWAEDRRQQIIADHSTAVRRCVQGLKLIDGCYDQEVSLRDKTLQFMGHRHRDSVADRQEVLGLRPSEMEVKMTLLHVGIEDNAQNRVKMEKYFGSAEYFQKREYFKGVKEAALAAVHKDGSQLRERFFLEDKGEIDSQFEDMVEYFYTNQLAISYKTPVARLNAENELHNGLVNWSTANLSIDPGRPSMVFPSSYDNAVFSNSAVRISLLNMAEYANRPLGFAYYENVQGAGPRKEVAESRYKHEFNQLLPYLQRLYVRGVRDDKYCRMIVDMMNAEARGYVIFVPGEGVSVNEQDTTDVEARLVNSLIADMRIELGLRKAAEEAKRMTALAEEQRLRQEKAERTARFDEVAKIVALKKELAEREALSIRDFEVMGQAVIDRETAKVRQEYQMQQFEDMKKGFLSLFVVAGDTPSLESTLEAVVRVLDGPGHYFTPDVPRTFADLDDFILKVNRYFLEVQRLYEALEQQLAKTEGKLFVRKSKAAKMKEILATRESVYQSLNDKFIGGELDTRKIPKGYALQAAMRNTEKELGKFRGYIHSVYREFLIHEQARMSKYDELLAMDPASDALELNNRKLDDIFKNKPLATLLIPLSEDPVGALIVRKVIWEGLAANGQPAGLLAIERHFSSYAEDVKHMTVTEFRSRLQRYMDKEGAGFEL